MDLRDLTLIFFGAVMTYAFGELRAYFDRKEQRAVRESDRAARIAEANADRHRALNMTSIAATRKTFMAMLNRSLEFGSGRQETVTWIDQALVESGALDHFDPALLADADLLTRITAATLEFDQRGLGNSKSWDDQSRISALKLEVKAALLRQERRVASGEEPLPMAVGESVGVDRSALDAAIGRIQEWDRRMREAFPADDPAPPQSQP